MRYIIIENEWIAVKGLKEIMKALYPEYELISVCDSIEESIAFLTKHDDYDFIFMDIELSDGNCFDIFRNVDIKKPIIFTTAYDEFAVKSFSVNVIDYLLKPITDEGVRRAIEKLAFLSNLNSREFSESTDHDSTVFRHPEHRRVLLSNADGFSFIDADKISFFISEDKYVFAVLDSGQKKLTNFKNLVEVSNIFIDKDFFQISRNIVASISSIVDVRKHFNGRLKVTISGGEHTQSVFISAARKNEFLDWMGHGR